MSNNAVRTLLRQMRAAVHPDQIEVTSDAALLTRYATTRDESAFELLVWRHAQVVFGVCRRVLDRDQDAEDAFQATFLTLACKAGTVRKRESVAVWLYRVAYRVALRARTDAAKQTRREQIAVLGRPTDAAADPAAEAVHRDLRRVLDQEISRLPAKYRAPVVLCYLEGKSNQEAAAQLDCPTGTVVTRLARARQRLRARLAARGLAIAGGAFPAALADAAELRPVRPAWVEAAVRTGTATSIHHATAAGLVPARVAALSRGVSHAMIVTKSKIVVAVLLVLGLAVAGPAARSFRTAAGEPPADQPAQPPAAQPGKKATADTGKLGQKAEEKVSKTFKTGATPRVVVGLHNGGIKLEATADREVSVEVTKEARANTPEAAKEALKKLDVKLAQDGDKITVSASGEQSESPLVSLSASAVLKVPTGAVLELNTTNGGVEVAGGTGELRVITTNGGIRVAGGRASQTLRTLNGAIHVSRGAGNLHLETNNGTIQVEADKAVLTATTTNGSVTFTGSLAEGKHSLQTTNGNVRLTLPADARFRIDAKTNLGSIASDFSVEPVAGKSKTLLAGSVGQNAKTSISVQTTNGSIHLQARK